MYALRLTFAFLVAALGIGPNNAIAEGELVLAGAGETLPSEVLDLGYQEISELSILDSHPQLRELNLNGLRAASLAPLRKLTRLKKLSLVSRNVSSIEDLGVLTDLEELILSETRISSLKGIENLKKLRLLDLRGMKNLKDISAIKNFARLEELHVETSRAIDFQAVGRLPNLKILSVGDGHVSDFSFLSGLSGLENLTVMGKNTDLKSIAGLTQLNSFWAERQGITDIRPLQNLKKLRELYLGENQITDLTPLSNLPELATLRISKNPIKDLSPIKNLPLTFLEAASHSIIADSSHCPVDPKVNPEIQKFCKRYIGKRP